MHLYYIKYITNNDECKNIYTIIMFKTLSIPAGIVLLFDYINPISL
jgi:hypothetical protein